MSALAPSRIARATSPATSSLTSSVTSRVTTPSATPSVARPTGLVAEVDAVRGTLGALLVVVVLTAAHVARVPVHAGDVVAAAVLVPTALAVPARWALMLAVTAWAWLTGFVVHTGGTLTLHAADVDRLGLLLAVAVAVVAIRRVVRTVWHLSSAV